MKQHRINSYFLVNMKELTAMFAAAIKPLPNLRRVEIRGNDPRITMYDYGRKRLHISYDDDMVLPLVRESHHAWRKAPRRTYLNECFGEQNDTECDFFNRRIENGHSECFRITIKAIVRSGAPVCEIVTDLGNNRDGLHYHVFHLMKAPSTHLSRALANISSLELQLWETYDFLCLTTRTAEHLRHSDPRYCIREEEVTNLFLKFLGAIYNVRHLMLEFPTRSNDKPEADKTTHGCALQFAFTLTQSRKLCIPRTY